MSACLRLSLLFEMRPPSVDMHLLDMDVPVCVCVSVQLSARLNGVNAHGMMLGMFVVALPLEIRVSGWDCNCNYLMNIK